MTRTLWEGIKAKKRKGKLRQTRNQLEKNQTGKAGQSACVWEGETQREALPIYTKQDL